MPRKWDDNFKAFNEVIKESGLDLSRVKNKKVDKWVVLIPAQSTETQKSYGVVLVYKNEAKGAYILQKPSGEVLPLKAAAPTGASLALTDEEVAANAGFGAAFPADDSAAAAGAGVCGANAAADVQAGADTAGPTEDAAAEAQAHHRDNRDQRVFKGVAHDDDSLRNAARTRGADIILPQFLQKLCAHHPCRDSAIPDNQAQYRQQQMFRAQREQGPVPLNSAVQQIESGHGIRAGLAGRKPVA